MNTAQEISERIEGLADELRSDRLEVDRIFDDAMKACGSAICIHAKTAATPPSSTSFSARYETLARIRTIIQTLPDGLSMKHLERLVTASPGDHCRWCPFALRCPDRGRVELTDLASPEGLPF